MASFRKGPVMKLQFLLVCVLLETGLSSVRASEILRSVNQVFVNCTLETFECAGDKKCLPKKFLCDGINHCADHSDETGCLKHVCDPTEFFQCDHTECYPLTWRCDGQEDCHDGYDESDCPIRNGTVCGEGHFKCKMGLCAPESWRCDGHEDCPDGSDESDCKEEEVHESAFDFFQCNDKDKKTVPARWVCDGGLDCPNGRDEEGCYDDLLDFKNNCSLPDNNFACSNKRECIPMNRVCNGIPDCSDRSDEEKNCTRTCSVRKCEQGCVKIPSRFSETCFCEEGFRISSDGQSCEDIDECLEFGQCSQFCNNSRGSFECSCHQGYELSKADNRSCNVIEKSSQPVLFFAAKTVIGRMGLGDKSSMTVTHNKSFVRQAIGISYDAVENRIFWTNLEKGKQAILSSKTDGSNVKVVMNSSLKHPEDLAVDSFTRNFYYTDSGPKIIGVCTLDGLYCHKLLTENIDQPRAIALHQERGILVYTDWGLRPHISIAGMDGSNHRMIVTHNLKWPNGVVIDRSVDRIFWADAYLDRVESTLLDGTDRRIVIQLAPSHPFSVSVFEDNIFWSDWSANEIQSCNKFTGAGHRSWFKGAAVQPMGIHIFHENLEPFIESPCHGSPCDHICVKSPSVAGYACKCKDGYKVQNGTACLRIEHKSKVLSFSANPTTQKAPSEVPESIENLGRTESLTRSFQQEKERREHTAEPSLDRLDLHIDAIIGAVFGATALALFVLALCCCVHKKRSKKGDRPFSLTSGSRVSFERREGVEAGRITVDSTKSTKGATMKTSVSNANLVGHGRANDFVNRSLSHPDLEFNHVRTEDRADGDFSQYQNDCLVDEGDDSHCWFSDTSKLIK